jgi:hypothetical protein
MACYNSTSMLLRIRGMFGKLHPRIAWKVGLICVGLLMMAACQSPPLPAVTYSDLCGLTREQFGKLDEQAVLQWIQSKNAHPFRVPISNLPDEIKTDQIQAFGWTQSADTQTVRVAYLRNGQLVRVSIQDLQDGPTFGQVVAGLGSPDTVYRSMLEYEQVLYTMGLDYPAFGILVYTSGHENRRTLMHDDQLAVHLVPTSRVTRIECYEPQPTQDALQQIFFLSHESVLLEMQRRITWPGFDTWVSFSN